MNARDDLIAALTAERYNGGGWKSSEPIDVASDDDLSTARRRRELVADYGLLNAAEKEAQ